MKRLSKAGTQRATQRPRRRRPSQDHEFHRVMVELEAVATKSTDDVDPFVEQLRKCSDTFVAGEMLARMFDALKHDTAHSEDEPLLPPAGVVLPLV